MLVTGPMCHLVEHLFYHAIENLSLCLAFYLLILSCAVAAVVVFLFFDFSSLVLLLNDIFLWLFLIFALSKEATIILFYRNPIWPYVSGLLNNVAVAADAWFRLLQLHHNLRHNWKPLLTHNFPCISVM